MNKYLKIITSFLFFFVLFLSIDNSVFAAQFYNTRLRYDRMKAQTPTSLQIMFVPRTAGAVGKIKVVFGAGVTVAAAPVYNITGIALGNTIPGGIGVSAIGAGTSMIVSTPTNLTVGTTYIFNIGSGISTPVAGQITDTVMTLTSANGTIDQTKVASRFISDDQIVITANVPPSFTFILSGNTDAFTTDLTAASVVSTNGRTVTVTTNASKGWIGWVRSANVGLISATTAESILTTGTIDATPGTCTIGTDCYLLDADLTTSGTGSGTVTIDPEYNGTTTAQGGTLSTTLQPFVSRSGKTAGDVITLIARATIIGTKAAAADYTDTLTVIGAGNF